jgi:hypothetical protein
MASVDNLILCAFPRDGRYYRLDAVGTIRMVPDRITPMIEVQLTPLRPAFTRPTHDPRAFDVANRVLVTVSVGWYPILKMGSFWRNGRIQSVSSLESARFGVDTSLAYVRNRRAFDSFGNAPLISQELYNLHPHMTETRYLVYPDIQHGAYRRLIIPCTEISRFYYTNSTRLALHIFSGALILTGNDRVFDDSRSVWLDEVNGINMVQLGMHIPDTDHLTVGRIAASNRGSHTARYEARSLV